MKALIAACFLIMSTAACSPTVNPNPSTTTPTSIPDPNAPITYTVEPFDMDGTMGITMTVTQDQFGGRMCPCVKIPYPADGVHNQQGVDAINAAAPHFKPGDTLMGFSLGAQVVALYLSQHTLPPGVNVLLAGWTFAHNTAMVAAGQGIPVDIPNQVTLVVNEFDGWSDSPDLTSNPNYVIAEANAILGAIRLHYYANADLNNPANIKIAQGNITAITIPTQGLPLDPSQRLKINTAYSRPVSTPAQQAAAGAEQVPYPNPAWPNKPEPAATQ